MATTLDEHYGYLADRIKIEKYRAALEQLVRPEHLVLDLAERHLFSFVYVVGGCKNVGEREKHQLVQKGEGSQMTVHLGAIGLAYLLERQLEL